MPKKKDGTEPKKSRKSSAVSKDTTTPPSGGVDLLPPLNPNVTHLVASNPFDDPPPSNPMKMMHSYSGQSMMPIGSSGYSGWGPRATMRSPYNGPSASGWNTPMHGNSGLGPHGYHTNLPPNHMPNGGYGRPPFPGGRMPSYNGPSRMSSIRPHMGHFGSPETESMMMHDPPNLGPNHMVSSGNHGHMLQNTGQMKALTRPSAQMPSPSTRKNSTSSLKNVSSESKSPKNSDGVVKSRKKSEKKSVQDSKSRAIEGDKLSSNGIDHGTIPHSIPPKEPQPCTRCGNSINPTEDAIRCLASCSKWYHRSCVGLTPDAYRFLKSEELALWACDLCLQTKEIHSVRTRVPVLDDQMAAA